LGKLSQEIKKKDLTNPRKRTTIRISINYCCVPGKQEPAFVGLADLQNPPHKWHGFRIFAHNPEVSGPNPLPATNENRSPWGYGFLIGLRVDGYEKSLLGGFFDEP